MPFRIPIDMDTQHVQHLLPNMSKHLKIKPFLKCNAASGHIGIKFNEHIQAAAATAAKTTTTTTTNNR
jgi:hypothetical protein